MQKTQQSSNTKRSPIPKQPKSSSQPTTTVHQLTGEQLDDTRERARLAKIFTRLALATAALLVVITFFATTGLCDFALLNPKATSATNNNGGTSTNVQLAVDAICMLSATTDSPHTSTIAPGTLQDGIGQTSIKAACNDKDGWAIYAVGYGNGQLGDTDLHQQNDTGTIATSTATSGDTSGWAMQLDVSGGTYAPILDYASAYAIVPNTLTKVAHFDHMTTPSDASTLITTYRAYIQPLQAPGTYVGKVKYTLVHPSTAELHDITSLTYMQDMSDVACTATAKGVTTTLIDARDSKTYTVARLNDGNCWMTQNLDLDLTEGIALTPSTSDVNDNWLPLRSTIAPGALSSATWADSYTSPYSYDSGNTTNGNYYNWTAATASNDSSSITGGDATDSICPRGWRLPSVANNEFGEMLYQHNVIETASSTSYATGGFNILTSAPLSFLRAGSMDGGSLYNVGSFGYYWSSTARSSTGARYLYFTSGYIYPQGSGNRYGGISVRCVAR